MFEYPEDLNIEFSGSYELLKWILKKYKRELPYYGEVKAFSQFTLYSDAICNHWRLYGVNPRTWNNLNKDLIIAGLTGKIKEPKSLFELKEQFNNLKKK